MTSLSALKVLFISNDASRTGAPIVLLHLLKWLKQHTDLQFDILLLSGGSLLSDFKQTGETYVLTDFVDPHSYSSRIKKKLFKIDSSKKQKKTAAKLAKKGYDLIYGNTVLSLPWLKLFRQNHQIKTMCCIHELSFALNHCFNEDYLTENLNQTDRLIAVSESVRQNLLNSYHIPTGKISLHYEFIDTDVQIATGTTGAGASPVILNNAFIIGAGGTPEWRKGVDLIIPLALKLVENYPAFKFKIVWLGANKESNTIKQILYDIKKCQLTDHIFFIKNTDKPLDVINTFDVFVSFSREDPFPLIALEAAYLQKPVIAFDNSGGIIELLKQGAGIAVPYLDIDKLAKNVYDLSTDIDILKKTGARAKELVQSKYSSSIVSPSIYTEMINLLAG